MIVADKGLYIKLGSQGHWEEECIRDGTIRLGYDELPHDHCLQENWSQASKFFKTKNKSAISNHMRQVASFYTEPVTTLWITIHGDRLWWCFAKPKVTLLNDLSKTRTTVDGWHGVDAKGDSLIIDRLNGHLVSVRGYQGTICSVPTLNYLLHKINGTLPANIANAKNAYDEFIAHAKELIHSLHPKDFEVLIDLIFRQGGLNRTSVLGETEKDIDIALVSPITGERIAVQVKSASTSTDLDNFINYSRVAKSFKTFYFVTHTTKVPEKKLNELAKNNILFWNAADVAEKTIQMGLAGWLMDKAA